MDLLRRNHTQPTLVAGMLRWWPCGQSGEQWGMFASALARSAPSPSGCGRSRGGLGFALTGAQSPLDLVNSSGYTASPSQGAQRKDNDPLWASPLS